jgi:ribosomal 50S subunit-recycling heat shock protein
VQPLIKTSLLSLFVAVLVGVSTVAAQTDGAMLFAQGGNVRVNGQYIGSSTSVFSGDRIDVPASSAVSINRTGSSVVVSADSSVQYNQSAVEVLRGTARVSTTKGMLARAGQVIVVPQTGTAKFDIIEADGKVTVVSHEGALTVKDGNQTLAVASGGNATLASTPVKDATLQTAAAGSIRNPGMTSEAPFYSVNAATDGPNIPVCGNVTSCPQFHPHATVVRPCRCPHGAGE